MTQPVAMTELWRGPLLESLHLGHAVICDDSGQIVQSWGDPDVTIYPRSSAKMIQGLPLITSGAAAKYGLNSEHLALACASHSGAAYSYGPGDGLAGSSGSDRARSALRPAGTGRIWPRATG